MLKEIPSVRQIPGEAPRRWFHDETMDLFVWNEGEAVIGFQLSYDKPHRERTLTWHRERGYQHTRTDEGLRPGRHPGTPLLVADGIFDGQRIAEEFRERAEEVEVALRSFVLDKILHAVFAD